MADIDISVSTYDISISVTLAAVPASYVAADTPFRLDGAAGDTYLQYDSTSGKVELYVDGTKSADWS